jgi:hypothetical protein
VAEEAVTAAEVGAQRPAGLGRSGQKGHRFPRSECSHRGSRGRLVAG